MTTKRGKSAKNTLPMLRVKQVRSGIDRHWRHRRTLRALGLKHHQDEVTVRDHPAIRGMLEQVRHLIHVETVEES